MSHEQESQRLRTLACGEWGGNDQGCFSAYPRLGQKLMVASFLPEPSRGERGLAGKERSF